MTDVYLFCLFYCMSSKKLLHTVGLEAAILTYLLRAQVVTVKFNDPIIFRRDPEIQDYKILKQHRIANLRCKAFQTVKFYRQKIIKTIAKKKMFSATMRQLEKCTLCTKSLESARLYHPPPPAPREQNK